MRTKNNADELLCLWCLKPLYHNATLFDLLIPIKKLCHKCASKIPKKHCSYHIETLSCTSMVVYDKEIERVLYRYKEDGDLPLATSFFYLAEKTIKRHKDYVFVLMPSSAIKTKERGFFALEKMISPYAANYCAPFLKINNIKQSQQSAKDRKKISESIILSDTQRIKNQKIILIDDVCTTGSTLLSAYKLIVPYAKSVKAFTFAVSSMVLHKQ